jgi:hypothetical protein
MIQLGDKVFLKACRFGLPGTVIRRDHGKFTVFWPDMDHWSRHKPEALELAETAEDKSEQPGRGITA